MGRVPYMGDQQLVKLADLKADVWVQLSTRQVDQATVKAYAEAMEGGAKFPPIVVFQDGATLWLADGFHRVAAARSIGVGYMAADVKPGKMSDAAIYACTANIENGRFMSNAEKREAAERLLALMTPRPSNREIAQKLQVSHGSVNNWARALSGQICPDTQSRSVTRDGTTYSMQTANIGQRTEPKREVKLPTASWAVPVPAAREKMEVHFSSETPEHYTPKVIVDAALECLGNIELDPCSNSHEKPNVPALSHYTVEDDGLKQEWRGRVYMNPPYGREIGDWVGKLTQEHEAGHVPEAIALVPARPDTQWWLTLRDYPVCFVEGRLTFIGNDDPAPFPSAVFYLGPNIDHFYYAFEHLGDIWQRMEPGMFGE